MSRRERTKFPPDVMERIRQIAADAPPLSPDQQAIIRAAATHVHRQRREAATSERGDRPAA